MTNSPNPFVGQIDPYGNPCASPPATPYTLPAHVHLPDSIVEIQIDILATVADYDALLTHIMAELRTILETTGHQDPDIQVTVAKVVSEAAKQAGAVKNVARRQLWDRYGSGTHATPGGLKFTLSKVSSTRRVDYKLLETKYTEAYQEAVKTMHPGPDSMGNLTIK